MTGKVIKKSDYKGVALIRKARSKEESWVAQYKYRKTNWSAHFDTERQAAVAYDKKMLELGREPVNVLVKKK